VKPPRASARGILLWIAELTIANNPEEHRKRSEEKYTSLDETIGLFLS